MDKEERDDWRHRQRGQWGGEFKPLPLWMRVAMGIVLLLFLLPAFIQLVEEYWSRDEKVEIDPSPTNVVDYQDSIRIANYVEGIVDGRESSQKLNIRDASKARFNPRSNDRVVSTASLAEYSGDIWWQLAGCETGYKYDNPNTGNGYYGYFQFDLSTWQGIGGVGYPHEHSYEVQRDYAILLQARYGWGRWPHCSRKLGLR